jgi:hypothetical protein
VQEILRGLAAACLLLLACVATAAEPRFEVRSASLEPVEGVYQLNVILELGLSATALDALKDGVPVRLELDVEMSRTRRYLPDENVASLVQRWQLQYHALSDRYLVTNVNTGQQEAFPSLEGALEQLQRVRALPVIDETLIRKGERYEVSVRIVTDVGGLPGAVKTLMFWVDWQRTSEWYTWSVET